MTRLDGTTLRALALAGSLLATPVFAEKPAHAGGGKPERMQDERGPGARTDRRDDHRNGAQGNDAREHRKDPDRGDSRDRDRNGDRERNQRDVAPRVGNYFTERHREVVRSYYGERYRSGSCPPGLARKDNGCMPPGLAKQWRIGYPLPRDLIYYDAPGEIVLRLGLPPEGHRYVRVAADILLIAVGTGLVVDAIEDLNRM